MMLMLLMHGVVVVVVVVVVKAWAVIYSTIELTDVLKGELLHIVIVT